MILLKGAFAFLLLWALLILGLGFGCARLPSSGSAPADSVQEP